MESAKTLAPLAPIPTAPTRTKAYFRNYAREHYGVNLQHFDLLATPTDNQVYAQGTCRLNPQATHYIEIDTHPEIMQWTLRDSETHEPITQRNCADNPATFIPTACAALLENAA